MRELDDRRQDGAQEHDLGDREEDGRGRKSRAGWPGRFTQTMFLQRRASGAAPSAEDAHAEAAAGLSGGAGSLPHLDQIQRSFGHHDVSDVTAHVGGAAAQAAEGLGAEAYAMGSSVAFRDTPSLHTAAHEAAHVLQQRAGVVPGGGVGQDGDSHEREADAIADRVVAGESAEALLDSMAGAGSAGPAVQRKRRSGVDLGHALAVQYKRHAPGRPALQLRRANGVNVSGVRFAPNELPADGVTTSQASVNYSGRIQGGAKINWSIIGDAFGASVSDTGLITPGAAITAGKDSVKLNVKATDSVEAGAWDSAFITLWDTKFLQAKKDYPKFIAGSYSAAASVGKFDMKYSPRSHSATAEMKLEFKFFDDNPLNKKDKWTTASKAAYKRTFVTQAQSAWSGKFTINNVAEPKSIWGKLNPVAIRVKATPVDAGGHFVVEAHRHTNQAHPTDASQWDSRAAVHGNSTLKIFQGDENTERRFMNADTIKGEQARVDRVNPGPIPFAADKADLAAHAGLQTFATYVKRVPAPRIAIVVAGHAGPGDTGTAAQKRSLSQRRAQAVASFLRGQGVRQHPVSAVGKGVTGALEARLTPTVDKNFRNNFQTIPHEFGHLLGLDDEYGAGAGAVNSGHSGLVKDAFDQSYADQVSKQDDDPTANIMHYGNQVRIHDYVTLWAALGDAAATAAVPAPPFSRADWKLNG